MADSGKTKRDTTGKIQRGGHSGGKTGARKRNVPQASGKGAKGNKEAKSEHKGKGTVGVSSEIHKAQMEGDTSTADKEETTTDVADTFEQEGSVTTGARNIQDISTVDSDGEFFTADESHEEAKTSTEVKENIATANIADTSEQDDNGESGARNVEEDSVVESDGAFVTTGETQEEGETQTGDNEDEATANIADTSEQDDNGESGARNVQEDSVVESDGAFVTTGESQEEEETQTGDNEDEATANIADTSEQDDNGESGARNVEEDSVVESDGAFVTTGESQEEGETQTGDNEDEATAVERQVAAPEDTYSGYTESQEHRLQILQGEVEEMKKDKAEQMVEIGSQLAAFQEKYSRDMQIQEEKFQMMQNQAQVSETEKDELKKQIGSQLAAFQEKYSRDMQIQEEKFQMMQNQAQVSETEKDELKKQIGSQLAAFQEKYSRDMQIQEEKFQMMQNQAQVSETEKDELKKQIGSQLAALQEKYSRDMQILEEKLQKMQNQAQVSETEKDELKKQLTVLQEQLGNHFSEMDQRTKERLLERPEDEDEDRHLLDEADTFEQEDSVTTGARNIQDISTGDSGGEFFTADESHEEAKTSTEVKENIATADGKQLSALEDTHSPETEAQPIWLKTIESLAAKLEKENDKFREDLKDVEEQLKQKCEEMEKRIIGMETHRQEHDNQTIEQMHIKELENKLSDMDNRISQLQIQEGDAHENRQIQEQMQDMQEQLKNQVSDMHKKISGIQSQEGGANENRQWRDVDKQLKHQFEKMEMKIIDRENQRHEITAQQAKQLKQLEKQVKKQIEEMEKKIGERQAHRQETVDEQNKQIQKQLEDLQEQVKRQFSEVITRISERQIQRQGNNAPENRQFDDLVEQLNKRFGEIERRINNSETHTQATFVQQATKFDDSVEQLNKRFGEIERRINNSETHIQATFVQQATKLDREIGVMNLSLSVLDQKLKQLNFERKLEEQQREQTVEEMRLQIETANTAMTSHKKHCESLIKTDCDKIVVELKHKTEEAETARNNLITFCEFRIKTECDKLREETEQIKAKHKQQVVRFSSRISKCEDEHHNIEECVNQRVDQLLDRIKVQQDTMVKEIDKKFGEVRSGLVNEAALRESMMNLFDEKMAEDGKVQDLKLEKLQRHVRDYVAEKNKDIQEQMTKLKHETDYHVDNNNKNVDVELHKIKENYRSVSDRVTSLRESIERSQREQDRKTEQQFLDTATTITDLQTQILQNVDRKLQELQSLIVNGDLLEKSTLNNNYQGYLTTLDGRLRSAEMKQQNVESQLEDMSRTHMAQLEHSLQQVKQEVSQKNADLKTDFNCQLEATNTNLQGLNASLFQSVYKIQTLETTQNRAPIGFSARTVGCHLKSKFPALKCFNEITCNEGGHYQPSTGIFTAPIAGIYVLSLSHTQSDEGEIFLNVVQSHRANHLKSVVACTWTYNKHSTSSDSAVVRMQEGDTLYVQLQHYSGSGQIWSPSSFCCFLIR